MLELLNNPTNIKEEEQLLKNDLEKYNLVDKNNIINKYINLYLIYSNLHLFINSNDPNADTFQMFEEI